MARLTRQSTMGKFLEAVFFMRSVPMLRDEDIRKYILGMSFKTLGAKNIDWLLTTSR
jgi:hypothetical protein